MMLVVILIGIVLVVTALRGTYSTLFTALKTDVPGFLVWGAALLAVGALGYVPGIEKPARYLMALVLTVIILSNYKNILAGFENAASGNTTSSSATLSGLLSNELSHASGYGVDTVSGNVGSTFSSAVTGTTFNPSDFISSAIGNLGP